MLRDVSKRRNTISERNRNRLILQTPAIYFFDRCIKCSLQRKLILVARYPGNGNLSLNPRNKIMGKKAYTLELIKENDCISLLQCSNNRHSDIILTTWMAKRISEDTRCLFWYILPLGNQRHLFLPPISAADDISVLVSLILQLMLFLAPGSNTAPTT